MHNKVVRFILNMGPRTHIGQRELDRVGLLSVKDRVIQMKMNHVYKIFHGTAPDYLNAHFTRVTSVQSYTLFSLLTTFERRRAFTVCDVTHLCRKRGKLTKICKQKWQ